MDCQYAEIPCGRQVPEDIVACVIHYYNTQIAPKMTSVRGLRFASRPEGTQRDKGR